MITQLTGILIETSNDHIVIKVGGIGYKVFSGHSLAHKVNDSLTIYTHYHVGSDNQPSLYGFSDSDALLIFEKLIKISGIGPKIGLKIVDSDSTAIVKQAILDGDYAFFTKVKGLGKKGSQKIILELKNTLVDTESLEAGNQFIFEALSTLKFTKTEIERALSKVDVSNLSPEIAIEKLLKEMGR